jgi:hypothetical protein
MLPFRKYLQPSLKVYWWRLNEDRGGAGNFGDEITKEIIEKVFKRRVEWAQFEHCQLVGTGSIIEEVAENKGDNKPYLWGSGFIQPGSLTISSDDFKILGVRGKESLKRVQSPRSTTFIGDPGLLASRLLSKKPKKQYRVGIVPHYVDYDSVTGSQLAVKAGIHILNPLWPCTKMAEEMAKCDTLLSSSLHGLIFADSLSIPNLHVKFSDGKIKGGLYKFNDYYSVYSLPRYQQIEVADLEDQTAEEIAQMISRKFTPIPTDEFEQITSRIVAAFPY